MWSGRKKSVGDFVYLSPLHRQKAVDTIRNEEVGFSVDRGHSLGSSRTSMLAEVGGRMVGVGGDLLKKQIRSPDGNYFKIGPRHRRQRGLLLCLGELRIAQVRDF